MLFLYAGVIHYTEGKHRFTGYVERVLGRQYKKIAFFVTLVVYYFVLLAYGVLGGLFLSNFFKGNYAVVLSFLFFGVGAFLVFLKLEKIALANLYLSLPLFAFVLFLLFFSFNFLDLGNFSWGLSNFSFSDVSWFLPYGVWIFSLTAFAAIPEAHDVVGSCELKKFKKVILVSVLLSALFYSVFIFNIIGISGAQTSEDSLGGLSGIVNREIILLGSIIGILAVFTSFLLMAADLRDSFRFDFGFPKTLAWFFTIVPPVLLFSFGVQDFTRIIGLSGSLGMGFIGTFLVLMAWKMKEKVFFVNSKATAVLSVFAVAAILLAVAYEIYNVL
ncbi:MAG: hypothetical protein COV00_03385 [Candidatus Tagabacteria bacterium CG10_big_fil_rev_8_21_14_0_10_40_13]|nr:MAG: hypothetical protein COV00_03385 [Candidatus Tagabacteria bacterium CG10_big_fil_rev_8_21_14_0_10_40_13]